MWYVAGRIDSKCALCAARHRLVVAATDSRESRLAEKRLGNDRDFRTWPTAARSVLRLGSPLPHPCTHVNAPCSGQGADFHLSGIRPSAPYTARSRSMSTTGAAEWSKCRLLYSARPTSCWVLLGTAGYCWVLSRTAGYCHVLLGTVTYCWVLPYGTVG